MPCNKIIKPEFTKEQIAECQSCKHASRSKKWCCHFGHWIQEGGRIIQPRKKLLLPKTKKPCDEKSFTKDYETAMSGHQGSNGELINLAEYIQRRRTSCKICSDKTVCPMRGCSRWRILVEKTRKCPENKW